MIKTTLIEKSETARYSVRSSPSEGLTKIGGVVGGELRYVFSAANASSQRASHWKAFFHNLEEGLTRIAGPGYKAA